VSLTPHETIHAGSEMIPPVAMDNCLMAERLFIANAVRMNISKVSVFSGDCV
jgi:hypothetical protein